MSPTIKNSPTTEEIEFIYTHGTDPDECPHNSNTEPIYDDGEVIGFNCNTCSHTEK